MSQGELAKIIGVAQPKISAWESQKKPIPAQQVAKIEAWLSSIYPS
jgi:DNA-binding transcriptional regulator YdaS (Cro superfamily)